MKKITTYGLMVFMGAVLSVFLLGSKDNRTQTNNIPDNQTGNSIAANSGTTSGNPVITMADAATHSTSNDCYLVINNKAYDVSSYINQHPGGRRNITSRCGQEVTGIFASIHSNFAWNLLADYYVADIGTPEATTSPTNSNSSDQAQVMDQLKKDLIQKYPQAEVISIRPKNDLYLAVMVQDNKLTEVHLDANGKVKSVEIADDEHDWNSWENDIDDD